MRGLSVVECENLVLREHLKDITEASMQLIQAVEDYTKQKCLRSTLMMKKENLKNLLK